MKYNVLFKNTILELTQVNHHHHHPHDKLKGATSLSAVLLPLPDTVEPKVKRKEGEQNLLFEISLLVTF